MRSFSGLLTLVMVLSCGVVLAAAPVAESQGQPRQTVNDEFGGPPIAADAPPPLDDYPVAGDPPLADGPVGDDAPFFTSTPATDSGPSNFAYEIQVLREEVQQLRGIVEEQAFRMERLEKEARDRYLDLDRRVQGGLAGSAPEGNEGDPAVAAAGGATPTIPSDLPEGEPGERQAYSRAVELTRAKQFQGAIDAFNQLLLEYPGGAYSANAFYWLGELYLNLPAPELERARQSFAQVVNLYPKNQKVPDALYKLGVVYHKLGDLTKSREYLGRVRNSFAGTTAARLAETYTAQLPAAASE